MNIQYVVLSADSNLDSRINPARNTWIRRLSANEGHVFLTDRLCDADCFPYNDDRYLQPLNYDTVSYKYMKFFKEHIHTVGTNYFFMDDDTYPVFPVIRNLFIVDDYPSIVGFILKSNMPTISWGKDVYSSVLYPSGGRGFFMNESCFTAIQGCVKFFGNMSPMSSYTDVTIGSWIKSFGVPVRFFHHRNMEEYNSDSVRGRITDNSTYHRVEGNQFFELENRMKDESVPHYHI